MMTKLQQKLTLLLLVLGITPLAGQQVWQPVNSPRGYEVLFLASYKKELVAGFGGLGLRRSSDGGKTWEAFGEGITNPFPSSFVELGNKLFTGTLHGGVYRSQDGGKTWTALKEGLPVQDVYCLATRGNRLYAGTGQGLYSSDNDGESWQKAPLGAPIAPHQVIFSLAAFGQSVVAGSSEAVYISDDKGESWTTIPTGNLFMVRSLVSDGKRLLLGSSGAGIWQTQDGRVWSKAAGSWSAVDHVAALAFGTDSTLIAAAAGRGLSGELTATDSEGLPTEGVRSVVVHQKILYAGTYQEGVWKYDVLPDAALTAAVPASGVVAGETSYRLYPNPTAEVIRLDYTLAQAGPVRIALYTAAGEQVAILADGQQGAGRYTLATEGRQLPPGIYYCFLELGGKQYLERVILGR
ncbi:MAG: hypothetical protein H6555_12955 [Lewinellaceae bacterium]|nr:hypothetical protein [Lewinellaceae bacterium]